MRAVAFTHTGGPEVLQVMDVADPDVGPGQIRIQVAVAAWMLFLIRNLPLGASLRGTSPLGKP